MRKDHKMIAFLAFAMYFLTGAACIVVGSSLPHLVEMYGLPLGQVVLLGSAYGLGRVLTVYLTGRLVEKLGAMKVLAGGVILIEIFLLGIPTVVNYYAGLIFAFLGGVGMGAQDTVCPLLLSMAFRENYAGSLSAGQAFFGMGNFATPFLVGLLLSGKLPFYYSYYILALVPVVMLICIPFARTGAETGPGGQEEHVKPLYARNTVLAYGMVIIVCAAYSAVVNTLMTYTSSFAEDLGVTPASAAFMLTVYNVGCFVGSLAFVVILKRISERAVLLMNNIAALAAVMAALAINRTGAYFVCLFVAGFFLGVLFSVIVAIATRIGYRHISRASSIVAMAGGGSDILTPVVTGVLVGRFGVAISYKYAVLMIIITIAATLVLYASTTEKSS